MLQLYPEDLGGGYGYSASGGGFYAIASPYSSFDNYVSKGDVAIGNDMNTIPKCVCIKAPCNCDTTIPTEIIDVSLPPVMQTNNPVTTNVQNAVSDAVDNTTNWVKDNPLPALAIAGGLLYLFFGSKK